MRKPRKGAAKSGIAPVAQLYPASEADWSNDSGDLANSCGYSSLNQVNTSNVGSLKVAWAKSFDTAQQLGPAGAFSGIQQIPIESRWDLYIATPNGLVAGDAVTGAANGRSSAPRLSRHRASARRDSASALGRTGLATSRSGAGWCSPVFRMAQSWL